MQTAEFCKNKLFVLDKRINAFGQGYRQNIAILGNDEREISYILENYLAAYKLSDIIYIHTAAVHSDRKNFFKSIATSILSEYLHKCGTFDYLINISPPNLNNTTSYIKDIVKRAYPPSFLESLEVINKFINESGKKCILIIENLLDLKKIFPNFHNDFSKFIILQRDCMLILTSLDIRESEKTLYSDLNFLFGNFEKIILSENKFLQNYMYLKNNLAPLSCSPFFISFFANILEHNIIYYDLMAKAIKEEYDPADETASIINIIRHSLLCQESYFYQKFMRQIDLVSSNFRNPFQVFKMLVALSEGYIRKRELASLHLIDSKSLTAKLDKLCELNYIENLGNVYTIRDSLFSFWLSHVFAPLFFPTLLDKNKLNLLFVQKIEQAISLFKEDFFKDKIKKILELITLFKNDNLKIGKDRCYLPGIIKSKLMSYPQKNIHFLIGEGHEIIFVGIKEDCAEDSDIFDFVEKGSAIKGKKIKKIFISLGAFSDSAKLAAKNNRLTIWDINEINNLMRVYHKPIITDGGQLKEQFLGANLGNF